MENGWARDGGGMSSVSAGRRVEVCLQRTEVDGRGRWREVGKEGECQREVIVPRRD